MYSAYIHRIVHVHCTRIQFCHFKGIETNPFPVLFLSVIWPSPARSTGWGTQSHEPDDEREQVVCLHFFLSHFAYLLLIAQCLSAALVPCKAVPDSRYIVCCRALPNCFPNPSGLEGSKGWLYWEVGVP